MGLRILAAQLLKGQMPEIKVEQCLKAVMETVPVPENWCESEKSYAIQVGIILLKKYESKIETLLHKILLLINSVYTSSVQDQYKVLVLDYCLKELKKTEADPSLQDLTFGLTKKIIESMDKGTLLSVSPALVSTLLTAILGKYSRKDAYLRSAVKTTERYYEKWIMFCDQEIRDIVKFNQEMTKAKAAQELMLLTSASNTNTVNIPELKTTLLTSKRVYDSLFEALYLLSPLQTPTSPLPTLHPQTLKSFLSLSVTIATTTPPHASLHRPSTSLAVYLSHATDSRLPDIWPQVDDLKSMMAIDDVHSDRCLAKVKVLASAAKERREGFLGFGAREYLAMVRVEAQVLEVVSQIGNDSQEGFSDEVVVSEKLSRQMHAKLLDSAVTAVRDYIPSLHFSKEIIEQFFIFAANAMSIDCVLELISHVEDFSVYVYSFPVQSQCKSISENTKQPKKTSIGEFNNKIRKYSAVQEPLNDLASIFFLMQAFFSKRSDIEIEILDRCFAGISSVIQSLDQYLDMASLSFSIKKLYRTILVAQSIPLLHILHTSQLQSSGFTGIGDIQYYVQLLLSTDPSIDLHSNMSMLAIRVLSFQLRPFANDLDWPDSFSTEQMIAMLSPTIVERVKIHLLNYPNSHEVVAQLHLLAGLAQYDNPRLPDSAMPLLQTYFVKRSRPAHLLPVLIIFKRLLQIMADNKDDVVERAKVAMDEGAETVGNTVRRIGLQAFMVLPSTGNILAVETIWQCASLILDALLDVPMATEDHATSFSGNEPAHCVIDNTAGAFIAEIWPVIFKELETLCLGFLLIEDSVGSIALELIRARTDRRRTDIRNRLSVMFKQDFVIELSDEQAKKVEDAIIYFGLECGIGQKNPAQSQHSIIMLQPCVAFIRKLKQMNPTVLNSRLEDLLKRLSFPFLMTQSETTTQAKLLIDISRLMSTDLKDENLALNWKTINMVRKMITSKINPSKPAIVAKYLSELTKQLD